MKILELELEEGTVAIFCQEEIIDFVRELSDNFIYDQDEMAFFKAIHPEWASFILEQVQKQIDMQKVVGYQFVKKG